MLRRAIAPVICVLFIGLIALRIWRYATFEERRSDMPPQVVDAAERELFLTAQGRYSLADIAANGRLLPSERFRGFRANHDLRPQLGDRLCPITRTKANRECTWIVSGQTYEFCCPPCIAEFVRQAQEQPEQMLPPEAFVKRQ